MEEFTYPEIQALHKIHQEYDIEISVSSNDFLAAKQYYPAVVLTVQNQSFRLFVEDEYKDFQKASPLLSLCLVLRELEIYHDSDSYLDWCKECMLEPSNVQVKAYYTSLEAIYKDVRLILGKIDSQISDYDFGLNAGAAQKLRASS